MFEYKLKYTENETVNKEEIAKHHYDILHDDISIGNLIALHDKNKKVVTLTIRIKWLEAYTASGTARRMLLEMIDIIVHHKTKAKIKFNKYDMQTVAILELSGINHTLSFK